MHYQNLFSYFSTETYVVGSQKNRLNETVLLSTQNLCYNWSIRKYWQFYAQKFCLSWPMTAKTPISKHKKRGVARSLTFLFFNENICCGYSSEASQWDASNEHNNKCFYVEIREILSFLLQLVSSSKIMHIYFSPVTKLNLAYHK